MRGGWALLPFLLLGACSAPPPPAPAGARVYVVRGEVVQPPSPVAAGTQVLVRHEAIDDFVDASGKVVGMDAMIMPFDAPTPVVAKDLAVGDKVDGPVLDGLEGAPAPGGGHRAAAAGDGPSVRGARVPHGK